MFDDVALVRACRAGDQAAWECLVRRYQRLIYTVPRRMGLSDDQAAEVFQQVCVTLLERLHTITRPERLSAWLATTARRASWQLLRRLQATTPLSGVDEQALPLSSELAPDDLVERLEQQQLVRQALDQLDPRSRKLMLLLYYQPEPLSYAEIARRLGLSEGSIGPTRARCLQKLQRLLAQLEL
jgi:RNA polymerase sigma factor (sigma-70 family)